MSPQAILLLLVISLSGRRSGNTQGADVSIAGGATAGADGKGRHRLHCRRARRNRRC
jgi:hypothetical protein